MEYQNTSLETELLKKDMNRSFSRKRCGMHRKRTGSSRRSRYFRLRR